MRLEISRLIGHHGIGGGVGFVESIASEFLQQIENLVGLSFGDAVRFLAAGHKALPLLGHFLELLFAHGAPQQIRTTERVTSQQLRGLHYLLLINENAVGFFGNLFE